MKKDSTYRYTLQFPARTLEQQQAGELLERLGSKKSKFIVTALYEYIQSHPEIIDQNAHIRIIGTEASTYSRDELREIIKQVLTEGGFSPDKTETLDHAAVPSDASIDAMLDSLGAF